MPDMLARLRVGLILLVVGMTGAMPLFGATFSPPTPYSQRDLQKVLYGQLEARAFQEELKPGETEIHVVRFIQRQGSELDAEVYGYFNNGLGIWYLVRQHVTDVRFFPSNSGKYYYLGVDGDAAQYVAGDKQASKTWTVVTYYRFYLTEDKNPEAVALKGTGGNKEPYRRLVFGRASLIPPGILPNSTSPPNPVVDGPRKPAVPTPCPPPYENLCK
jgi:hypothetical protein